MPEASAAPPGVARSGSGKGDGMRLAESVTFGGSGLDRAAHLRGNPEALAALWKTGSVLPLWRGRVLTDAQGNAGWLAPGSRVLDVAGPALFLGLCGGQGRFAVTIPDWEGADALPEAAPGHRDAALPAHPALPPGWGFADLRQCMAGLSPRDAELAATAKALTGWHASHGFCAACGEASAMVQAGWQRTCPACGTHHFPRTDPVVIMLVERGNRLLLGRSPGWPEGMYSLLAGFVEPGETMEAAVRREVAEETGVRLGRVDYLASQPWPFPASLMLGARAEALSDQITLDPAELEDALWISREDLVDVLAGRHPAIRPGRKGAIAWFLLTNWLADRLD